MNDKEIIAAFGKSLKHIRETRGFTQEYLAHKLNSHFTHISRLENGHKQPTLVTIIRLAKIMEVDPSYFLKGLS